MKRFRAALALCLTLLVCVGRPTSSWADIQGTHMPLVMQDKANWCWAACAVAVLGAHDSAISQEDFVWLVRGDSAPEPGSFVDVSQGLSRFGINTESWNGRFSFDALREAIDANKVVLCGMLSQDKGGHMVAVVGYSLDENVMVMDPRLGWQRLPYAVFAEKYQGDYQWVDALVAAA